MQGRYPMYVQRAPDDLGTTGDLSLGIRRAALYARCITIALTGRALVVSARRGRKMFLTTRGARAPTYHGPVQRVVRAHAQKSAC
jgi:hypothetical protein